MNLNEYTSNELSVVDRENTVIFIPLGSVEQHGPHLPLGTKGFVAETIAYKAGAMLKRNGINCLIAPTFPFMPCHVSYGFQGNFSIGARTFSDAIYEIGQGFHKDGFKWIYYVNLSISPDALKAVTVAIEDLNTLNGFKAFDPMPLWNFSPNDAINQELKNLGLEPSNEIHADVKDTSILLDIDETLVKKEMLADLPSYKVNSSWEILKGNFSFLEMGAENGYLGTPSLSNKLLGSLITEEAAFGLSEAVKFTLDGNELPELPMQIRMLLKMVDLDEM